MNANFFTNAVRNLKNKRTVALVDGANFSATAKALQITVDFSKLLELLEENFDLDRAVYYTGVKSTQEENPLIKLLDYLAYNGWLVVTKPTKEFTNTVTGITKIKGNMDLEMTIDALEMAEYARTVVLFTGDGDFRVLVEALQRRGIKVVIISSFRTNPSMIADELRKRADIFIDLTDIKELIHRDYSNKS